MRVRGGMNKGARINRACIPSEEEGGNVACWLLNTLGQSAMGRNYSQVGLSVAA